MGVRDIQRRGRIMSKTKDGYLSANKLGITAAERKYLKETKELLVGLRPSQARRIDGLSVKFNMNFEFMSGIYPGAGKGHVCNAAGCIKGWMGMLAIDDKKGRSLNIGTNDMKEAVEGGLPGYWEASPELSHLFYPDEHVAYRKVTPKVAAGAIEHFLTTGHAWPSKESWGRAYVANPE